MLERVGQKAKMRKELDHIRQAPVPGAADCDEENTPINVMYGLVVYER